MEYLLALSLALNALQIILAHVASRTTCRFLLAKSLREMDKTPRDRGPVEVGLHDYHTRGFTDPTETD